MIKSTKSQLKLFHDNFDDEAFDKLKRSVQQAIDASHSLNELMSRLKVIHEVQSVEFAEDDDLENDDFIPGYQESEDESCDFLVILCFAELEMDKPNKAKYVEVCFYIVYNDVKGEYWIDAVSLARTNAPKRYATRICFFDADTHEPIAWCQDLDKDN